ncbi:TNT domain-containing protein [Amycolatopsis sp. NPDC050768]|uniref:TNT domain-containing protein n=1 Tax=Amycolatopsis sp. NPDC050768 TaxID=3154839 RepID=UPI0033ED0407
MSEHAEPVDTDLATGPIRLPAQYGGLLDGGFDDVPTPPTGTRLPPAQPAPRLPFAGRPYNQVFRGPVPYPAPPPPPPPPPMGALRTERESVLALFLVHMFPIGHLPVAADRPALQLPLPDNGSGPFDHPDSALLDDTATLEYVSRGLRRTPAPPADPQPPAALFEGYEPGAEDTGWPPVQEEKAVVLPENTWLDRFGDEHGRLFTVDGTPFAQRSLPESTRHAGYRRYRVVKPVPMWSSTTPEWFGQPGGGIRYRAVLAADELVTLGFLADVMREAR